MYEHNALGYWSGLALCLTKVRSSRARCPATAFIRGVNSDFYFLSFFSMKFLCANRIAPDGTPRSAVSHLGLFFLPVSHKRDARLI